MRTPRYSNGSFFRSARGATQIVGTEGIFGTGILADVYQEGQAINTEVEQLGNDLERDLHLTANPSNPMLPAAPTDSRERTKRDFFHGQWEPFHAEWIRYKDAMQGVISKLKNAFSIYGAHQTWADLQEFRTRLIAMHTAAEKAGFRFTGPPPTKAKENIVEQFYGKASDAAGSVWDLAKFAIYGGLGLLGVVAIGSLVSNLKSGKDPAANYMALARRGK